MDSLILIHIPASMILKKFFPSNHHKRTPEMTPQDDNIYL